MYRAIGFDWSGVVFFHAASFPQAVKDFLGIEKEDFQKIYYQYNYLINTTNTDFVECWEKILSHFGKQDHAQGFVDYLEQLPAGQLNTDMIALVKELKKRGYKVGLFSNNSFAGAKEARSLGIEELFDVTLFSAEVGHMKPHKEAFEALAGALQVNTSELIFIDDAQKSLEKAKEIGYSPILYTDMQSVTYRLNDLLHIDLK